ncbi:glycoside hydrolase family 16 protein, partial [Plenodomus tracheiphilus IPT5]
ATPWAPSWNARTWLRPATNVAPLSLSYLPSEVYITNNSAAGALQTRQDGTSEPATYLTLRTQRSDGSTQAAAELDYIDNVTTISMRMLARVRGSPGAVAGFFTYYNDTSESDVEILTRDGNSQVRLSNQPTADPQTGVPIPDASFNASLPAGRSTTDWNVYRLDSLGDRTDWYLNGKLVASTKVNVPKGVNSMVSLNMWSNGGGFTGEMAVGLEAVLEIQWVELFYNS